MGKASIVFVTTGNRKSGVKLAEALIRNGLAACVNIIDIAKSVYKWKGKICKGKETLLIIKTRSTLLGKLYRYVGSGHPYSIPEIVAVDILKVNKGYLDWLFSVTKD